MVAASVQRAQGIKHVPLESHFVEITTVLTSTGQGTTANIPLPPCRAGQEILALCFMADDITGTVTFPTASPDEDEWSEDIVSINNSGNSTCEITCATKIATEEDSGGTLSLTLAVSQGWIAKVYVLSGIGSLDDILGRAVTTGGVSCNSFGLCCDFPSLVIPEKNFWTYLLYQINDDNLTYSPDPASYALRSQTIATHDFGLTNRSFWKEELGGPHTEQPATIGLSDNRGFQTVTMALRPTNTALYLQEDLDGGILNPGAEDGGPNTGWGVTLGSITRRTDIVDTGTWAFSTRGQGAQETAQMQQDLNIPFSDAQIDAGLVRATVTYRLWAQTSDSNFRANLSFLNDESPDEVIKAFSGIYYTTHSAWATRTELAVPPAGARRIRIQLDFDRGTDTDIRVWIDNVTLTWDLYVQQDLS